MSKRILFQGDSITDCGRIREDFYSMGTGYANLVKASLGYEHPEEYEFINRGISGDRIVDLYARIKIDFINLKPDYASILIGVNDVWHDIALNNGVNTDKFEKIYTMLIDEIKEACPDTKIMILSPYVLDYTATCSCEEIPDRFMQFETGVAQKLKVSKKIADKYGFPFVNLQKAFDEACKKAHVSQWVQDGVHPTACGHEIIKRLWLEAFEKNK